MYMYVCMYLFIRSNRTFVYLRMTAELVDCFSCQTTPQTTHKKQQNTYSGVAMCQKVCVWGGGGHTDT